MSGKSSINSSYTKATRLGIIIQYVWITGEFVSYVNSRLKESREVYYNSVGRQGIVQLILDSFREDLLTKLVNETDLDRQRMQYIFTTEMIKSTEVFKSNTLRNVDRYDAIVDGINERLMQISDPRMIHDEVMAQIQIMKDICKKADNSRVMDILNELETKKIPGKDMMEHNWSLIKNHILEMCRIKQLPNTTTSTSTTTTSAKDTRSQSSTASLTTDMLSLNVSTTTTTLISNQSKKSPMRTSPKQNIFTVDGERPASKSPNETKKDEGSSSFNKLIRNKKTKKNQDGLIDQFDSI